jgi:hypothetical protein
MIMFKEKHDQDEGERKIGNHTDAVHDQMDGETHDNIEGET